MNPGVSEKQPLHVMMVREETKEGVRNSNLAYIIFMLLQTLIGTPVLNPQNLLLLCRWTPKWQIDHHVLRKKSYQLSCSLLLLVWFGTSSACNGSILVFEFNILASMRLFRSVHFGEIRTGI